MNYRNYNVSRPRKVMQNGEEKTFWDSVGKITIFTKDDGSESGKLELYSFANRTIELNVFPQKQRENKQENNSNTDKIEEEIDGEIRVENIPF